MTALEGKDITDIGGGFGDGGDFLVVQVALLGMLETIEETVTFQGSLLGELKFEILRILFCDEKFSILFSRDLWDSLW